MFSLERYKLFPLFLESSKKTLTTAGNHGQDCVQIRLCAFHETVLYFPCDENKRLSFVEEDMLQIDIPVHTQQTQTCGEC